MLRQTGPAFTRGVFILRSLLIVAAAGLTRCGDGARVSGGACVTNQNCPPQEQCVGGKCVLAVRVGCSNDSACSVGEYCDLAASSCRPIEVIGCSTDGVCPSHQRCNTLTSVCIDGRRACTTEAQCATIQKHCDTVLQQCVDCLGSSDCARPTTCVDGTCREPATASCSSDAACNAPPTVCEATRCVPGCQVPGSSITCATGTYCDSRTGRCAPGQVTCTGDAQCSPPASICEASQCIPGCGQVGGPSCGTGTACNTTTGRCSPVTACSTDPQCGPPARVCESNQCIPGCGQVGGIQCSGNSTCNQTTGRCVGPTTCTSDTGCSPPNTICNLSTSSCQPGCAQAGCTTPETCNAATGHCTPPTGSGLPLNSACNANSECASTTCFDFEGSIGKRCVASCGNSVECPASFTCYDYNGAKMCLASQIFSGATFAIPNGASCSEGAQCHSNFCPGSTSCVDTCNENTDCGGGQCKWYEFATSLYIGSCNGPAGANLNGAACTDNAQCRSGVCYGSGICGDLCGTSADCPSGTICDLVNYSECLAGITTCLSWQPNFVRACVQATHGTGAIGTACTGATACRSGLCHLTFGLCTDTCSRDADCPSTHRCKVENYGELSDGTKVFINVCKPTAS